MKRYLSFLISILGFVPILAVQGDYYYYYKGERIYLTVDSTCLFVVSEGEFQPQEATRIHTAEYNISKSSKSYAYDNVIPMVNQRVAIPEVYFSTLDVPEGITASQYDVLVAKIKSEEDVWQVLPSFTENGNQIGVTNNFYVKLKSADDLEKLQQMAVQYGFNVVGNNKFMPLWYTLSCNATSSMNAIEAADLFHESRLFACSEPEFTYNVSLYSEEPGDERFPNDPYYPEQWNLKNTGQYGGVEGIDINVEEAWETTKGDGVVVAVYDQGSHVSHADLIGQFSKSYNAVTDEPSSFIVKNKVYQHGTNCAGIIGAIQNNGIGLSGVAPEAKMMNISIDLMITNFTAQQAANGFNWAMEEGTDVISCSWGGVTGSEIIDDALDNVLSLGREGKGCIVVFAAGNEGVSTASYPGNCDPRITVVGGITPMGKRAVGTDTLGNGESVGLTSSYGERLDVMAPSILVPTTSVYVNEWGIPFDRYYAVFGGTSAACPHVAGVAALILSVNPNLTVDEVEYIIHKTARKVRPDLYSYQKDSIRTYGRRNIEMGYGLIDATAAIKMAKRSAIATHIWNQRCYSGNFENSCIDVEDVILEPGNELLLFECQRVLFKSSVQIKAGSKLTIYGKLEE